MRNELTRTMTNRHLSGFALLPTRPTQGCSASRYIDGPTAALRVTTGQHSGSDVWHDAT